MPRWITEEQEKGLIMEPDEFERWKALETKPWREFMHAALLVIVGVLLGLAFYVLLLGGK